MAKKQAKAHPLAAGEEVTGEAKRDGQRIAVTSAGRKVVLNADGGVIERLMGPEYDWEKAPAEDEDEEA